MAPPQLAKRTTKTARDILRNRMQGHPAMSRFPSPVCATIMPTGACVCSLALLFATGFVEPAQDKVAVIFATALSVFLGGLVSHTRLRAKTQAALERRWLQQPRPDLSTVKNLDRRREPVGPDSWTVDEAHAEIRRQNEELRTLATRDPLTMCLNRRSFNEEFRARWSVANSRRRPLSCMMVDIDFFKSINDLHGHLVGDRVLQQVAEVLLATVRTKDLVCRYGGEEFCVLFPGVDLDVATQVADRFRQALKSTNFPVPVVTASVGVSATRFGARDPWDLVNQADKALYTAKRAGRDCVVRWDQLRQQLSMGTIHALPSKHAHDTVPEILLGAK